ncbi:MAG: hypothetical protein HYY93_02070, partial [Planctomycetes bacterium]|nr:hypothetical protein [Planctomycetota bacterium]
MAVTTFTDLFLDTARRVGRLDAAGVEQGRTVWLRLRDSGHQVPIPILLVALGLVEESAVEAIESAIVETPYVCPACKAVGDGADVLKFRSLNCSRCGKMMEAQVPAPEGPGSKRPVPSPDQNAATMLRGERISPTDTTKRRAATEEVGSRSAAGAARPSGEAA